MRERANGRRTTLRMARLRSIVAIAAASAIGVLMTACGSGSGTGTTTQNYTLTVDSTNPASGVSISVGSPLNNVVAQVNTPFTETAASGTQYILTAPATAGGNNFSSWTGCTSTSTTTCDVTLGGNTTVTASYATPTLVTPTVTVTPASSSITTAQSLSVTITVASSSGTPTGSVTLTSGSYSSGTTTLSGGSASVTIAAGALATGTDTLTAAYTPDTNSSSTYNAATGTAPVTVTAAPTFGLTIDSTNPTSGVQVSVTLSGETTSTQATTPQTVNLIAGTYVVTAPATANGNAFSSWTGCTSVSGQNCTIALSAAATITANYTASAPTTYGLTIDSTNPAGGVNVTAAPADVNGNTSVQTPVTLTYDSGAAVTVTAPATTGSNTFASWTGCASTSGTGNTICSVTMSANTTVTANYTVPVGLLTPTVTVQPASASVNTQQSLNVTVTLTGSGGTPTGSVVLSNGKAYTSSAATLSSGTATITVPAGALGVGVNTLTATYTPDSNSSATYNSATGTHPVTVNLITPTVTVTPQSTTISNSQALPVTVAVAAPSGDATPTGSVVLSSGSYNSAATTLASGSATITIPAGTLPDGSDTLSAAYTPDTTSADLYNAATGSYSSETVGAATTVSVNQSTVGAATTDKILGVNLESWYDVVQYANSGVLSGLQTANMQSLRWPGGSWSDVYHWNNGGTPYQCTCANATSCTANSQNWAGNSDEAFGSFETNIPKAGGFDLALTANYGTNEACTGGGDPAEAAGWAAAAVTNGYPASHITIGNEEYGSWETDLHATAHDPTTYADAVIGTSGYYASIKTAITNAGGNPNDTLVGVVVDADCTSSSGCTNSWDSTMLPLAKGSYDFVEYHYYPEYQSGYDSNLIGVATPSYVANFTANINTIKQELTTAGEPNTPIYVGEISSNSANGGTQNWSITQALYAGQILGEAMNDGVSRLTWWDSYGNCMGTSGLPPNNSTLYGWQDWGAQNIFGTGSTDVSAGCNDGNIGTLSPTAMAFQLFSNVAVNGENVLTATVTGDTTDVRAYAATHSGGTALVLFNLNKTTAEAVNITLSGETSSPGITVLTYDKEMYDYTNVNCESEQTGQANGNNCTYDSTHNYTTVDWVQAPTTTTYSNVTLPATLTLQPWSMNVVIIQ